MRKVLLSAFVGASVFFFIPLLGHSQALQAGIGADFFTYDRTFLDLRATLLKPLKPDVEIFLGGSFALATHNEDGKVEADFFIPLDGGVNFLFPIQKDFSYTLGFGLTAQFLLESDRRFYMGPFMKVGIRYKIHPYMTWYLEGIQDLVIGKPDWINISSRVHTGILFHF
ncbi:MAG: hypothetical protein SNJ78_00735 [Spirochaetales bacterium]